MLPKSQVSVSILILLVAITEVIPAADPKSSAPAGATFTAYVSNERDGTISIINTATESVIKTLSVGKRPRGMALSPDASRLYVALCGSPLAPPGVEDAPPPTGKTADGIGLISLPGLKLDRVLPAASDSEGFSISPDGQALYIANEDSAQVTMLDTGAGKPLGAISVGAEPEGVTTSPDGKLVFVACEADNKIDVIDTGRRAVVSSIETGPRPRSTAFTPDGAKAFATCENGACVEVIDVPSRKVVKKVALPEGSRPMGLAVSRERVYVSAGRARSVIVLDAASHEIIHVIENVGERVWGVAVTPDGGALYTANGPSNDVTVIDTSTFAIRRRIPAGNSPWGVVIGPQLTAEADTARSGNPGP